MLGDILFSFDVDDVQIFQIHTVEMPLGAAFLTVWQMANAVMTSQNPNRMLASIT